MISKGFSLLETVIYIAILALVLPMMISVTLGLIQKTDKLDLRGRLMERAQLVSVELERELTESPSVSISTSLLDSDDGTLVYVDLNGVTVTIDRPTVSIDFPGGAQNIHRLRFTRAGSSPEWVTDADMDVAAWRLSAVRDSTGILTGVRVQMTFQMLNPQGGQSRNEAFTGSQTIHLQPQTTEL
ncbi:hypothetical protein HZA85_02125 [Candidatus Uhrbacteria bacterium]|nr:hypothetical protein [Candidatus Uhrbacteria bacterium]